MSQGPIAHYPTFPQNGHNDYNAMLKCYIEVHLFQLHICTLKMIVQYLVELLVK